MNLKLIILAVCILAVSSFTILQKKNITPAKLNAIPWPFTVCGNGDWVIQKLALSQTPARNQNMDMDIVIINLFSWEKPLLILILQVCTLL